MGLIRPPCYFTRVSSSLSGTPSATIAGQALTANANDVDSAVTTVLSALAHDVHYLVLQVGGFSVAGAGMVAMDVLIDTAGGTPGTLLIADLAVGYSPPQTAGSVTTSRSYHFPLYIPAGATVGVRQRTRHTANITTGRIIMHGYGDPSQPQAWWCGRGVETLGITGTTGANSYGTSFTTPSGSWGSWTTIGTSTRDYGAVQFGCNGAPDATSETLLYEYGYGSNRLPCSPGVWADVDSSDRFADIGRNMRPIFCSVASGTVWQGRGYANGLNTDLHHAIYGVF